MTDPIKPDEPDKDRNPGWYWVRDSQYVWEPAEYALTPEAGYSWWYRSAWYTASDERTADEALGCEIGPRIDDPDVALNLKAAQARKAAIAAIGAALSEGMLGAHSAHWDRQGTHGANCPACKANSFAREKLKEALRVLASPPTAPTAELAVPHLPAGIPLSLGCIQAGVCRASPCICAQAAERARPDASDHVAATAIYDIHFHHWLKGNATTNEQADALQAIKDALAEARRVGESAGWDAAVKALRDYDDDVLLTAARRACAGYLAANKPSTT